MLAGSIRHTVMHYSLILVGVATLTMMGAQTVVARTCFSAESIGPAIKSVATYAGLFTTDPSGAEVFYGVTRSGPYCRLFRYRVATAMVDLVVPILDAKGAWSIVLDGSTLYIGTYLPAALYHYDIATGILKMVTRLKGDEYVWSMKIIDGILYFGTYPSARVLSYDLSSGALLNLGTFSEEKYVRSLESSQGKLYTGIGAKAQFVEYDLTTGEKRDLLPEIYRNDSFVYHLTVFDGSVNQSHNLSDKGLAAT
jgi:outer membrane protein assembly factor BamB